jgi:hypothetical protein
MQNLFARSGLFRRIHYHKLSRILCVDCFGGTNLEKSADQRGFNIDINIRAFMSIGSRNFSITILVSGLNWKTQVSSTIVIIS